MQYVAAERSRAAAFDGRHDLQLAETEVASIFKTPCRPLVAEDVRDLQSRPGHGPRLGGLFYLRLQSQRVQGTWCIAQGAGRHLAITRGVVQLLMP